MIIANPLYDVVFKRLMENDVVAKFFIGTLLEETVVAVELQPQEFTYTSEHASLAVFRLDFLATIKTDDGEFKKILIEIQKARNPIDVMRFRNYLGEQYKKEDVVEASHHALPQALPITTVYILGFTLPEVESPCIKVERTYKDLITKTILPTKSAFIEKLTHDCFVVQVERITDRYQTRLDKLLSLFEQRNFTDTTAITKDYRHTPDVEEIKTMRDILHYVGTSPEERKEIEIEREAWRTVNAMFAETREKYEKKLAEKDQALSEKDRIIAELMKKLGEE
jgi:transcriptional regulator of heat shock response